jgi:hypothetical protein
MRLEALTLAPNSAGYPTRSIGHARYLVRGFVAIAVVSFAAGWLAGTMLAAHVRLI